MNMHKKRIARRGAAFVCAFGVALSAMPVHAAEVKSLEDKTSNLQSQLEGINQDLVLDYGCCCHLLPESHSLPVHPILRYDCARQM